MGGTEGHRQKVWQTPDMKTLEYIPNRPARPEVVKAADSEAPIKVSIECRRAEIENHSVLPRRVAAVSAVTGPHELVHGERESFIGVYRWQRSRRGLGIPGLSGGGVGSSRVSSR
ncbi:hypothetical protein MPSD_32490 [Mycobacterium pseudoshottsii JCM 15466]|nr:hypothetical protein MPSD_32490 [Mycobacterium pseudoshottsii JCM 15466]